MRSGPALFLGMFLTTAAFGAQPRVVFARIIPAPHDLGKSEDVAIIGAYNTAGGDETAPNTRSVFTLAQTRARTVLFPMFWKAPPGSSNPSVTRPSDSPRPRTSSTPRGCT